MKLVSIIMPVYNSEQTLKESIHSIFNQTYKNWELIIVEDGSADNSLSLAQKYESHNVRVLGNKENKGVIYSRNRGIDSANGELLAFIDSDDSWGIEKLEKQIKAMEEHNTYFSCTAYNIVDDKNEIINKFYPAADINFKSLLKTCSIGTSTVMVSRDVLGDSRFKGVYGREDYILWLELLKKTGIISIQDRLTNYRVAGGSLSSNKLKVAKLQWQVYRKYLKLNMFKSSYYFIHYMIAGMKKSKHLIKKMLILSKKKKAN